MKRFAYCCLILALALVTGCKKNAAKKNPTKTRTAAKKATTKATKTTAKKVAKKATKKVDTSLPGDPVAGEKVYKSTCSACHGKDGKGNGGVTGADFVNDKSRLAKDNAVLLKSIRDGKQGKVGMMPPQKSALTEKQIKDSLAYVRKAFGGTKK